MDPIRSSDVELALLALGGATLGFVAAWVLTRRIGVLAAAGTMGGALLVARDARNLPEPDVPGNPWPLLAGAIVVLVLLLPPAARWIADAPSLMVAVSLSAGATWTAVPETGYVLVVGGAVGMCALASLLFRRSTRVGAAVVLAAAVAASAVTQSDPSSVRRVGAIACLGLLLSGPVGRMARLVLERVVSLPGIDAGWWLLAAHVALAALASRWVSVDEDATWTRVVVLGAAGVGVGLVCRPRARLWR